MSENGPENWCRISNSCCGRHQSPININTDSVIDIENAKSLHVTDFYLRADSITIKNDETNVKFQFSFKPNHFPKLNGGPLKSHYILHELHFHFGGNTSIGGSEHLIDGVGTDGEVHIIFYNSKYANFENAVLNSDGIAVLARLLSMNNDLYRESQRMDAVLEPIFFQIEEINSEIVLTYPNTFSLYDVFGDIDFDFFTYKGSLTTPGCNEVVTFLIADEILLVDVDDVEAFRNVKGFNNFMAPNIRQIQPIRRRKIMRYIF